MKKQGNTYYNQIDEVILWNWRKLKETGNLAYLRCDKQYKEQDSSKEGIEAYRSIRNQIYDEHGISDEFKMLMKLKVQWIHKKADAINTDDRFKHLEAKIIKADQDQIISEMPDSNDRKTLIDIQKLMGFHINERKITVDEYLNYIKQLSNG